MTTRDKIYQFILEELQWDGDAGSLTDDYPLIEKRVLDSLGIFNLVSYVEDEFSVAIQDEELVPDNFGTIQSITAMIDAKRSAAGT
jgi:acyl carrier protein